MGVSIKPTTKSKAAKKAVNSSAPKLSAKQIKFCKEVANGENYTNAAIKAKYSKHSARKQGSRLRTNAYINERIELEKQKVQEKLNYTLEQHFKELEESEEFAKKLGNPSAALSAVVQKGKLCGLYTERIKAEVAGSISLFNVQQFLEKFNAEK